MHLPSVQGPKLLYTERIIQLFYCFFASFCSPPPLDWPLLPVNTRLHCSPLPEGQRARTSTILLSPASAVQRACASAALSPASAAQQVTLFVLQSQAPRPFVHYWRCISKVSFGAPGLSVVKNSEVVRYSGAVIASTGIAVVTSTVVRYMVYKIPLLGVPVNGGSTVYRLQKAQQTALALFTLLRYLTRIYMFTLPFATYIYIYIYIYNKIIDRQIDIIYTTLIDA